MFNEKCRSCLVKQISPEDSFGCQAFRLIQRQKANAIEGGERWEGSEREIYLANEFRHLRRNDLEYCAHPEELVKNTLAEAYEDESIDGAVKVETQAYLREKGVKITR